MNSNVVQVPPSPPCVPPSVPKSSPPKFPLALLLTIWLTVVLTCILVTAILPRSYQSVARVMTVSPELPAGARQPGAVAASSKSSYLATEVGMMESELVLGMAVATLSLNEEWGRKFGGGTKLKTSDSVAVLRGRINVRAVPDSQLIQIESYSEDANEAARVANAIVEVYQGHHVMRQLKAVSSRIEALEEGLRNNQEKASHSQKQLDESAGSTNAPDTQVADNLKQQMETLAHTRQTLAARLAEEQVNLRVAASQMPEIVDRAVPALRPSRPNVPLNLILGVVVGAVAGVLLASLVYLVRWRIYVRSLAANRATLPFALRLAFHFVVALVVGVVIGYNLAMPVSLGGLFLIQLALFGGGAASAFVELVNPYAGDLSSPVAEQPKWKDLPRP